MLTAEGFVKLFPLLAPYLVEALALVHDVGHPPFGHAGERILDSAMREHGDLSNHNLHALRTVEQLERRYAAFWAATRAKTL